MTRGGTLRRRVVLAGVAGTTAGLAGCSGVFGGGSAVSVLAAGSLNDALENGLRERVDQRVTVESHGSARVARLVAEGQKDPDIVAVADVALFESTLRPDWYAEFATNSLVLAYDADSQGGRRVAAAGTDGWWQPLLDGDVSLGRTDPDLDPLGYRTLFALELANDHYDTETDLRAAIPDPAQLYPETQLVSQFETGAIDAAFTYRSMAVDRGYAFLDLPAAIDLGDPSLADQYGSTSYELPDGTVVSGAPISYAATLRHESGAANAVFEALIGDGYLTEFGFTVPEAYPRYTGQPPDGVAS
ncbi:extracellular solute-binding protein [Haloarchaeobius litoreus]|uniref:Extracellular solute-binding protein n=1 Tax=Haloarchaeobius litoreus TaxID=755306 RepID=A0ABD6DRF9_9EURY|nr:extracellular solute-binding protein [Haloarchaeobius litoreus]